MCDRVGVLFRPAFFSNFSLILIANIVTISKALVTTSKALVSSSFLLLLVRHLLLLLLLVRHLFLVASCYY